MGINRLKLAVLIIFVATVVAAVGYFYMAVGLTGLVNFFSVRNERPIESSDSNRPSDKPLPDMLFLRQESSGFFTLFVASHDGLNLRKIADGSEFILLSPTLSPRRDKLAYLSKEDFYQVGELRIPKTVRLKILDLADGSSRTVLSYDYDSPDVGGGNGRVEALKFSPDGKRLAYTTTEKNDIVALYILNLENFASRKLVGQVYSNESEKNVDWSPDSREIVYMSGDSIHVTGLEGKTRKLISGSGFITKQRLDGEEYTIPSLSNPLFTADGRYITFEKITEVNPDQWDADGKNLFRIDVRGMQSSQLTSFRLSKDKYIYFRGFVPGSNKVLVEESWPKGHDPRMSRLIIYDHSSKNSEIIYEGEKYFTEMSPDGSSVAFFVYSGEPGVYVMKLSNKEVKKLFSSPGDIRDWR